MERNQKEIQEKLQRKMEEEGFDALLLTRPESIRYATGVTSAFMYLNIPIGNVIGIVPKTGNAAVVMSEFEGNAAKIDSPEIDVLGYPIFVYIADFDANGRMKDSQPNTDKAFHMAAEFIKEKLGAVKKIGVERPMFPYDRMLFLQEQFGEEVPQDCTQLLKDVTKFKTAWEIEVLRKNAQASQRAMSYVAKHTEIGMDEQDILLLMNQGLVNEGKGFCSTRQCNVVGEQFSPIYLPHTCYKLKEGDTVRLDGGINSNSYSSDISRTYFVGNKVSDERLKIWNILHDTFEKVFTMIGPGVRICDIFKAAEDNVKTVIPEYHRGHFGHSVGCYVWWEEYPTISRHDTNCLEPGMVMNLEIPYYSIYNNSYNFEDTFLVNENGIDRFTRHSDDIYWRD